VGAGAAYFSVDVNRSGNPVANVWAAEDWGFYYQGIIGAAVEVGPKHRLFVEYRYFSTIGVNAESNFGTFTPDTNDDQFRSHSIMAGFRISF
jgi:opacity protein-like surface antigen